MSHGREDHDEAFFVWVCLVLMSKCTIFYTLDVFISNEKDTLYINIYLEIGI